MTAQSPSDPPFMDATAYQGDGEEEFSMGSPQDWSRAGTQLRGRARGRSHVTLRHRWRTWKGQQRGKLRRWLGVEDQDVLLTAFDSRMSAFAKGIEELSVNLTELRKDVTEGRRVDADRMDNLERGLIAASHVVRAWRSVPLLRNAEKRYHAALQIQREREIKKAEKAVRETPHAPQAEVAVTEG